ncbi:MAG: hypothetical protein COB02_10370 [Candidatus Cloacimonadota bacterium]|nr:MAG: hypothetical protein COB02_10370 [Candidatus Cloacimonadota bacterium]
MNKINNLIKKLNLQDQSKKILYRLMEDIHIGKIQEDMIHLNESTLQIGENTFERNKFAGIFIVAIGQAAPLMNDFIYAELNNKNYTKPIRGIIFTKDKVNKKFVGFDYFTNQTGLTDTLIDSPTYQVISSIETYVKKKFHIIVLLSDGASSMLNLPEFGVSLPDNIKLNETMMKSGLSLYDINIVKSHISKVKSGKFIKLLHKFSCSIFRMSQDISGNNLKSGICSTQESTYKNALNVLRANKLLEKIPKSIIEVLKKGMNKLLIDTLKESEISSLKINYLTLETIETALNNIEFILENNGAQVFIEHADFDVNINEAVEICFENLILSPIKSKASSACFIYHGQIKINRDFINNEGKNQHFCLQLGSRMLKAGFKNFELMVLSSNGLDGSSRYSGAFINESMYQDEENQILAEKSLLNYSANSFFKKNNALIELGSTGAIQEDLVFLICQRAKKIKKVKNV